MAHILDRMKNFFDIHDAKEALEKKLKAGYDKILSKSKGVCWSQWASELKDEIDRVHDGMQDFHEKIKGFDS